MLIKTLQTIGTVKILYIKESLPSIHATNHKHIFYGCDNGIWFELSDKNLIFKDTETLLTDLKTAKPLVESKLDWMFKYYLPNAVELM
jgi:hypothetical protein